MKAGQIVVQTPKLKP